MIQWLCKQHLDFLPEDLLLATTLAIGLSLTGTSAEDLFLSNTSEVVEEQTNAIPDPYNDSTIAATVTGSVISANGIAEYSNW